jgi:hypothetical protein
VSVGVPPSLDRSDYVGGNRADAKPNARTGLDRSDY